AQRPDSIEVSEQKDRLGAGASGKLGFEMVAGRRLGIHADLGAATRKLARQVRPTLAERGFVVAWRLDLNRLSQGGEHLSLMLFAKLRVEQRRRVGSQVGHVRE